MGITNQEEMDRAAGEYGAGFDNAPEPVVSQSDDDAFGLNIPEDVAVASANEETSEGEVKPEVAVVVADAEPDVGAEGASPAGGDTPAPGEGVAPNDDTAQSTGSIDIDKEMQRLRTKEGRLNAREAELNAREEQMNAGAMTYDQAYSTLAEDFGEDFVKMIQVVASHAGEQGAGPAVSMLQQSVEQAISNLDDERMRMHFERIYEAHPDFVEITDSPQFVAWLEQNPDYKPVVESGSARSVIAMLDDFTKKGGGESDIPNDEFDDMAAGAEGVRSSGLRLPEEPSMGDGSFEDEFNKLA